MNKKDCAYILKWSKKIRATNMLGGKCSKCGNDDIVCLDFHHKQDKDDSVSSLFDGGWTKLEKEIKKCVLLCRNCHMEEHMIKTSSKYSVYKIKFLEIKGVDRCQKCGYKGKNNSSLDFHHREEEEKDFVIGNAYRFITDMGNKIELEIKKCDVLCRNCHAKEHFDYDRFNLEKENIEKKSELYIEKKRWDNDKIMKLHNDGLTNLEICKEMNLSPSTVSTILKRMGVPKFVRKPKIENKICPSCNNEFLCEGIEQIKKRVFCSQKCKGIGERKLNITKDDLEELLKTENYSELARRYNVVPNTIKNLAKRYNLI